MTQRRRRWETLPLRVVPTTILNQPFAVFLALLCIVAGLPLLLTQPKPTALEALLPTFVVYVWAAMLVLGGTSTLVGIVRPSRVLERLGMDLLGPASLIYAVCVVVFAGRRGIFSAAITVAFALACLTRAYVLRLGYRLDSLVERLRSRLDDGDT